MKTRSERVSLSSSGNIEDDETEKNKDKNEDERGDSVDTENEGGDSVDTENEGADSVDAEKDVGSDDEEEVKGRKRRRADLESSFEDEPEESMKTKSGKGEYLLWRFDFFSGF
jgi:hypothetical protein